MADLSATDELEPRVEALLAVLIRFAAGDWDARAVRDGSGDPMDVLGYMINATIEEVGSMMEEQIRQRQEIEQTHRQLLHTAKLAALGELAGGVAHELNQPLTVVKALASMAKDRPETLTREDLDLMLQASHRMSTIVDGIRSFARRSLGRLEPVEAMAPVHAAAILVRRAIEAEGHRLSIRGPEDCLVMADPGRLEQVFVNLLVNAVQALARVRRPGVISVVGTVREDFFDYVVRDDGPGVPDAAVERIFEPFYTTKEVGEGTGLGLSVSYGIVDEHGGTLALETVDQGAQFRVRLPLHRPTLPKASDAS